MQRPYRHQSTKTKNGIDITNKRTALEVAIKKTLTGYTQEEIKSNAVAEPTELYRFGNGFFIGNADDFDSKYAIDETHFWHFFENTQKEELEKLQRASTWKLKILERYDRMVKKYGLLRILKKGLEVEDAFYTVAGCDKYNQIKN